MLTEGLVKQWDAVGQSVSHIEFSYHCSIWLLNSTKDQGPKPFRMMNAWLDHSGFKPFVENRWRSYRVEGNKGYVIKEKLKFLKKDLNTLNKEVFEWLDLNIDNIVKDLNNWDDLAAEGIVSMDCTTRHGLSSLF